jgi:glutaredoxin-related protein
MGNGFTDHNKIILYHKPSIREPQCTIESDSVKMMKSLQGYCLINYRYKYKMAIKIFFLAC